tara:strand:- start:410 stop:901 length:492 start_codon:yes stop_codon:yes gene_type:complete
MAGENSPKERLEKLDEILDSYEIELGIPQYRKEFYDDSSQQYLELSRDQIEKLTPDNCAEAALLLASLSFHLQRSYNRELARVNWADHILRSSLAGREQQYKGSWESQFNQAVKEDTYATKVQQIKRYAQHRSDRLTYLASSVKNISDIFLSVQKAKAFKHGQ